MCTMRLGSRIVHPVPDALGHDDRLPGVHHLDALGADVVLVAAVLEDHVDPARDDEEQLVAVGMQLAAMRRVPVIERRARR